MNPHTKTVASRIDAESKTKLELAAEECDVSLSAYLKPVLEEHIDRNPHGLRALESDPVLKPDESDPTEEADTTGTFIDEMLAEME